MGIAELSISVCLWKEEAEAQGDGRGVDAFISLGERDVDNLMRYKSEGSAGLLSKTPRLIEHHQSRCSSVQGCDTQVCPKSAECCGVRAMIRSET
jgi:hypothetical protein